MSLIVYTWVTEDLNFINIIEAICLSGEGNNPSVADVQFHVVIGTPSLYMLDIGLQQSAVISRIDSSENFYIISK